MEASKSVAQLSKDLEVKEKELAIASVKADKVNKNTGSKVIGSYGNIFHGNMNICPRFPKKLNKKMSTAY